MMTDLVLLKSRTKRITRRVTLALTDSVAVIKSSLYWGSNLISRQFRHRRLIVRLIVITDIILLRTIAGIAHDGFLSRSYNDQLKKFKG